MFKYSSTVVDTMEDNFDIEVRQKFVFLSSYLGIHISLKKEKKASYLVLPVVWKW